jgi:hypothetical protein
VLTAPSAGRNTESRPLALGGIDMKTATILCLLVLAIATSAQAKDTRTVTVLPTVTASIVYFPYFNNISVWENSVYSYCSQTTPQNLEWRRGFMEFELPADPALIVHATLALTEGQGSTPVPVPSVLHEVSIYPADLVVDTSDYDIPTLLVGTLEIDPNNDPGVYTFMFDVTGPIQQLRRTMVGFRVKLAIDPDTPCLDIVDTSADFFSDYYHPPTLTLEVLKKTPKDHPTNSEPIE